MQTRLHKPFLRILCIFLSIVMLSYTPLNALATEKSTKLLYIKDIKLIYAESKSEAQSYVPEGYTLLEYDLNKGTEYVFDVYEVYLAYSTTENPDEAITDIKMMNMNGGFVLSDYEEQLQNVKENIKELANDVKAAASVFAQNYKKGTYGAKAAYRALNSFTVDEANGQGLADYFLYGNPADEFFVKLILNAHQNVLSSILSALAMAVQGEQGDTWLDRLTQIDDPWSVREQPDYWDKSEVLWEQFYGFYKVYNTIDHDQYVKGNSTTIVTDPDGENGQDYSESPESADVDNTGIEALHEVAYMTLEKYSFGSGETFSEVLLGAGTFNFELCEVFYTLLEVMTPEEEAMMRLCGPLYMILATGMDESTYKDYISRLDEITGGDTVCSIWAGVNAELFRSSIGITDEAARAIAETEFEQSLNNEGDSKMDAVLKTAGLVASCGAVALGVGIITYYGFGALMLSCFGGTALYSAISSLAVVGTIFGAAASAAGIGAIVVALVVAVVYLVVWLSDWWDEHHPEYTEIPEYMYDYITDESGNSQFVLYEGVRFQDGRVADVNAWEGKEWHAMYLSRDKAAGAPIEADIMVKYGDGRIDDGYAGLAGFGKINAENLNLYADDDEVSGIYVTYRQEDLKGDYARGTYLSDVKLFSDEDPLKCKLALENEKYVHYNVNLTPNGDKVTYLGYKTTNNVSRALTDIRVAYGYSSAQYNVGGGVTYAASGSTGDGQITLYSTRIGLCGSPILSDFLVLSDRNAPAGYEPVNLFSGGPAVSLNLNEDSKIVEDKAFYFYFLPSQTYTSGTEYLGGLTQIYDQADKFSDNGAGSVEKANKLLGYEILYTTNGKDNLEGALAYTTTYNPYRAIYNITASKESETMGNVFAKTATYDGVGYSLVDRYIVNYDGEVGCEYFATNPVDVRLYVSGICDGGTPMRVSDLFVSADQSAVPTGFTPVTAALSGDSRAVDLANGFLRRFASSRPGGQPTTFSFDSFYLFVRGEGYKEGNYLTNLFLSSKEQVLGGMDLSCDNLDNSYVANYLAAQGAHTVIGKNLNLEDSDNATYLAYTKASKTNSTLITPITDVILYYAGKTNAKPEYRIVLNEITYHLVSDVNLFCEENGENDTCDRVYLYYTTNPAAGSSIIDIKIDNTAILNGWETARTQNGKALYDDMDDYESSMWFIHLKRTTEEPKYISEVVIGVGSSDADAKAVLIEAGCDYMLDKDLNDNVGAHSDYVYLGYKRTSNPNEAIRDLRTTHDDEVDSFVKNGATYYKIEGNLNSYTNVFADDIFLYYTKDARAGSPIILLETSKEPINSTRNGNYFVSTVVNQKDKNSDLNDGAAGDYIYLLQIRDENDQAALASMIGNGSLIIVIVFVIVSGCAIVWIYAKQKKRRLQEAAEAEMTTKNT